MHKLLKYYFVSILLTILFFIPYLLKDPENKVHFDRKFYPADYELIKRTFPYYDYDKDAYKDAFNRVEELRTKKRLNKKNNLSAELEFIGPSNIGGRVVDIEFNPISPNIVYAAAATGGVFKSTDVGKTWIPIFDDQPSLSIGDIGIDPNNPDILYVGTGEANGGHNNFPGNGVYKSTNGGSRWEFIGLDSTASIGRILVDPENSSRIFVAAVGSYFTPNPQRGVYLSEDGGRTWNKSLFISDSTGAIDLVIDPSNSQKIYAAMWERVRRPVLSSDTHLYGPSGGIFKSVDGGKTWYELGPENGLPDPAQQRIGRIGLAISKSNPSVLFALYNDGLQLYGLYKSSNEGNNWIETSASFKGSGNFSWYFGQVRVHPVDPQTVFVLDVSLFKSSDDGYNWDFTYGYSGPSSLHVDHHALAFHPENPDYILSGNDGGINISINGGVTWSQPAELPITQFYEIGLDETNPERFYGGTQDNGTIRTNTGSNNDWKSILGGDGFYVIVDPSNADIIYAETQFGGLGKSKDGGLIFSSALQGIDIDEPRNWSTPVIMDPNNSEVLYYGTHTLYRSENGAESWSSISPKLTDYTPDRRVGTLSTIAVAPTNSDVIYVGTDDGYVWVSSDYGNTWKNISTDLPYRWVTRVAVDPKDENIIYATFSGLRWADPEPRVFRSSDMGDSWTNISSNLPDAPINAFEIDKNNGNILYLGNDVGAFVSYNSGQSWEILAETLPIVVVNDIKIHPIDNYLAIGTHGRGIYKVDLNNLVNTGTMESNIALEYKLFQNYPNPFNPSTIIKYTISSNVDRKTKNAFASNGADGKLVSLRIHDILGQEITTLVNQKQEPGNYEVIFNASNVDKNFSSGIYIYTLQIGNFIDSKKMLLIK